MKEEEIEVLFDEMWEINKIFKKGCIRHAGVRCLSLFLEKHPEWKPEDLKKKYHNYVSHWKEKNYQWAKEHGNTSIAKRILSVQEWIENEEYLNEVATTDFKDEEYEYLYGKDDSR